jgi:nicotinate-nucleotide adenylyltransferase
MNISLYFGSFNPPHIGHLIIAEQVAAQKDIDEVWFVVSPHNPLKNKNTLLNQNERWHMVCKAIENDSRFKGCDIEFSLPQPSYTIHTLQALKQKYPRHTFSLLMGEDNIQNILSWKNGEDILKNYVIKVYPRLANDDRQKNYSFKKWFQIQWLNAPLLGISSSLVREMIKSGMPVRYLLPPSVWEYIMKHQIYTL